MFYAYHDWHAKMMKHDVKHIGEVKYLKLGGQPTY